MSISNFSINFKGFEENFLYFFKIFLNFSKKPTFFHLFRSFAPLNRPNESTGDNPLDPYFYYFKLSINLLIRFKPSSMSSSLNA